MPSRLALMLLLTVAVVADAASALSGSSLEPGSLRGSWFIAFRGAQRTDLYAAVRTTGETLYIDLVPAQDLGVGSRWIEARLEARKLVGRDGAGHRVEGSVDDAATHIALLVSAGEVVLTRPPYPHLSGRIMDRETGTPIVGASVRGGFEDEFSGISDRRGSFDLGMAKELNPFEPFSFFLDFRARGYAPVRKAIVSSGQTFDLEKSIVVTGHVVNSSGSPISRAHIEARTRVYEDGRDFLPITGVTDRVGAFRIEGLPSGDVSLHVKAPRYLETYADVPLRSHSRAVVTLERAITATGIVKANGKALPRVDITICGTDFQNVTRTDDSGIFRVDVPKRAIQFIGHDPRYGRGTVTHDFSKPGRLPDMEIDLVSSGLLAGRVVDEDGQPASGVALQATAIPSDPCGTAYSTAITGSDGRFEMRDLVGSSVRVEGGTPWGRRLDPVSSAYAVPSSGLVLTLGGQPPGPMGTFHGRVVDDRGGTIAATARDAVVVGQEGEQPKELLSLHDGVFDGHFRHPGDYEFRVCSPDVGMSELVSTVAATNSELTMKLLPTSTVVGRILVKGKPAVGADVTLLVRQTLCEWITTKTGWDGRFQMRFATDNGLKLELWDERIGRGEDPSERPRAEIPMQVAPGQRLDLGDLEISR